MSEIDATVIKRTQETLGKYVKRPVLSDKLLKKPPFRFLHDVFNTVIRETGYFDGLYTAEELNYETITDREAKMKFLQKMIDAIKLITNVPMTVRTSKIVAGHEPENTNELLQLMGLIIEKKLDWKTAVESINSNNHPATAKGKSKEKEVREISKEKNSKDQKSSNAISAKKSENLKDRLKTESKEKVNAKESKEKVSRKSLKTIDVEKEKNDKKSKSRTILKEPSKKVSSRKTSVDSSAKTDTTKTSPEKEIESSPEKPRSSKKVKNDFKDHQDSFEEDRVSTKTIDVPSPKAKHPVSAEYKKHEETLPSTKNAVAEEPSINYEIRHSSGSNRSSSSRKSSGDKSRKTKTDGLNALILKEESVDSLKDVIKEHTPEVPINLSTKTQLNQVPSANTDVKRESTFVREDSKEFVNNPPRPRTSLRPPSARPASARPGAPRRRDKNIEIVLQPNDQIKLSGISVKLESFTSELEDDGENLVIIEDPNTEHQLEGNINKETESIKDDSLHQGHLVQQILETQKELVQVSSPDKVLKNKHETDISNIKSRQSSAHQMNSLRDVIQNLTKSVNPLGKLMDFIPEDIDAMQLELTMWRDVYNQSSIELKKERSLTETITEPMKNQLVTLEANIEEYREMIDSCRAKILQNAEKIQRLLTTQ